ncbi:thiamine pyrophosphate-binding protein [Streptomyces sp. NPDC001903]|uniref:thiamine pyrophosphate-binding protein n=1 Tax=Streptomyces sp. NPDC001903 TaxID=3364622 RepID=UPI00367AE3B8
MRVSHQIAEILRDSGFARVFGVPGREASAIDFLLDEDASVECADPAGLPFVLTRHEYTAAGMAIGASRATGEAQACWVTLGPGVTHIMSGVATAMLDRNPVLILGAQIETGAIRHNEAHQCLDNVALMRPITKYAAEVHDPADVPRVLAEAIAATRTGRPGPAFVSLPIDVLESEATAALTALAAAEPPAPTWGAAEVSHWADALRSARTPLIVAGDGVVKSGLAPQLAAFARKFDIPVAATYTAHGVVPVDSELYGGVISSYADVLFEMKYLDAMFADTDLILLAGYDSMEHYPNTWRGRGGAKRVLALSEWEQDDSAFGAESSLVGAPSLFLDRLAEELGDHRRPVPHMPVPGGSLVPEDGSGPLRGPEILSALSKAFGRFRLAADIGMNRHLSGVHFTPGAAGDYITSPGLSGFGIGLPLGMGAALADPSTPVVVLAGDGGFHSNSGDLETAARLGLKLVVIVADSTGNGLIQRYQALGKDVSRRADLTVSNPVDFVRLAEANGVPAVRAESFDALLAALTASAATPGPLLVHAPVRYGDLFINAYEKKAPGHTAAAEYAVAAS